MDHPFKYTLKVWLTSEFISPILLSLYEVIHTNGNIGNAPGFAMFGIIIGGIASLPSALMLWFSTYLILKTYLTQRSQKMVLTFIGILLTWLPFCIITREIVLGDIIAWPLLYALLIVAGIWVYQLPQETDGDSV